MDIMDFFSLSPDFLVMFSRLLLNVLATFIIIDRMYYRKSHRRDFYFTFMLIPIAIFFIVFFMIFVLARPRWASVSVCLVSSLSCATVRTRCRCAR